MGDESQIGGIKASCDEIMMRPAFIEGYESIKRKAKFNYLHEPQDGDEWQYERGRQFAIYLRTIGKMRLPLKKHGYPNWRLVHLLSQAFREGAIT